jgi:MAP/microtubule affinity-regulating kinase
LGVLLFAILTGHFPYKGSSDEELYQKINGADFPKHDPALNKKTAHLLSKMFTIVPEDRITA